MIINTNTAAMNTHRQMGINQEQQQSAMEKLSSGLRINKAGDDAAGLAISEKMRGQINGLDQASRNAQDGISMIQTAEGALDESHSILQRMRELSVQSANDTNVDADREELQNEVDQLASELDRIADNTEFNTQNLLDGDMDATFQIGANEGQNLSLDIDDMSADGLGVADDSDDAIDISTQGDADGAISTIDDAIEQVSSQRSELGAVQNRLEHTISNLDNSSENLSAAESRIRDADMANQMMEMTQANVKSQAAQSMLAQANQQPQSVLQLLG